MTARRLDRRRVADDLPAAVAGPRQARIARGRRPPGLAAVPVGDDAGSTVHALDRRRGYARVDFRSFDSDLPVPNGEEDVGTVIGRLKVEPEAHGILLRLPLPDGFNPTALINRIDAHPDSPACASWITPVRGKVGPMTMATLIEKTPEAAATSFDRSASYSHRRHTRHDCRVVPPRCMDGTH